MSKLEKDLQEICGEMEAKNKIVKGTPVGVWLILICSVVMLFRTVWNNEGGLEQVALFFTLTTIAVIAGILLHKGV